MTKNAQVAAHACAAHETALAAELLSSLPRRGPTGTTGRRSPQPSSSWPGVDTAGGGSGVGGVFVSRGGGGAFAFQRSFLRARGELLCLLGACWGMCQVRCDLQISFRCVWHVCSRMPVHPAIPTPVRATTAHTRDPIFGPPMYFCACNRRGAVRSFVCLSVRSFVRSFVRSVSPSSLSSFISVSPQDLSATRTNRYARFSRREARCRRLPAAFRRLAGDFRQLRGLAPGAGPTTSEPLRAASCLCLFLAIAADALLSQGKSVLMGSRDKSELVRTG